MLNQTTMEIITAIANIALALSLVVAVIFGIAQVRAAARDRRERLTLETLRHFQTRDFAELIFHINSGEMPQTYEEFQSRSKDEQIMFIEFAQHMESLGIALAEHLINMDLVDKTLGSWVVTAWDKYKPVFSDMRVKIPDPYLGEYFQWLAERIKENMRRRPRKPFFEAHKSARHSK